MEEAAVHYITLLAMDDGIPPMSAYYDIPVVLTNVNDRQTSVEIEPKLIPEEIEPGNYAFNNSQCRLYWYSVMFMFLFANK